MKRLSLIACSALVGISLHAGGFGVGIQKSYDMDSGSAVVPRLDYLHATDSSSLAGRVSPINLSATANILSLGVDYNYFIGGETGKGLYILVGLGLAKGSLDVSESSAGNPADVRKQQWRGYPEAGLGYQFTKHVGVELLYKDFRFHDVPIVIGGEPVAYSLSGSVQASLVIRF